MTIRRDGLLVFLIALAGLFGLASCVPAAPSIPTSTTTSSIAQTTTTRVRSTTTTRSTIPPTTTTTVLPDQNQIVFLGEVSSSETGCERTDMFGSDADAFTGQVFEVCKDSVRGVYKLIQLVVPGPGRLPLKLLEQDLLPVPVDDEWTPRIELIEAKNRVFVFMGSELLIFAASNGQSLGTVSLPVSGRYSVDSVSYLCGGSSNALDFVSGRVAIASDLNRKVLILDGSTGEVLASRDFVNEHPLSVSYSMRTGTLAMTAVETLGEGYGTYTGVTREYVLDPDTLETIFLTSLSRISPGQLGMHKSCSAGEDLMQTENSAMATEIGTASGEVIFKMPNSRYYNSNGPSINYAGDKVIRVVTNGVSIEGFDYSLRAFLDFSLGNRSVYVADMTWQESGRMNIFWYDGSMSVYCISGNSNC